MNNENKTSSPLLPKAVVETISKAYHTFSNTGALSGLLLILMAIISLVWVNLFSADSYHDLWYTHFSIGLGDFKIDKSLHIWINDGLMAIFFFYIGLEIKREVMVGELSQPGKVILPIFAAIGGMLLPAAIYVALQWNEPGFNGWGIPMATDIAFSLGILMLLGDKVPTSLKIFLTAFAIVDDLGAVMIIALFYSADIQVDMLLMAGATYLVMWALNLMRFRKTIFFVIPGFIMWYFVLRSGVHPTVAGILAAFAIPARKKLKANTFVDRSQQRLNRFMDANIESLRNFLTLAQLKSIDRLQADVKRVAPPLQRLEYILDDYVAYLIMPLFALSNAGVALYGEGTSSIFEGLTLDVFLSLMLGKVIGVYLLSWLAVKIGIAVLPDGMNFSNLLGVALLGGVGFTMSLFIANLAFTDEVLLTQAKIGVLAASFTAGLFGFLVLKYNLRNASKPSASSVTRPPEKSVP